MARGVTPVHGIWALTPWDADQLFLLSHMAGTCWDVVGIILPHFHGAGEVVTFLPCFLEHSLAFGALNQHVKSSASPRLPCCEGAQAKQRGRAQGLWSTGQLTSLSTAAFTAPGLSWLPDMSPAEAPGLTEQTAVPPPRASCHPWPTHPRVGDSGCCKF